MSATQVEEVLKSYDRPAGTHHKHPVWQLLEEIVAKRTNISPVTANRLRNILWQFKEALIVDALKANIKPNNVAATAEMLRL